VTDSITDANDQQKTQEETEYTPQIPVGVWRLWTYLYRWRAWWWCWLYVPFTTLVLMILLSPYLMTNRMAARAGVTVWDPKVLFVLSDGGYLDRAMPFVGWTIVIYTTIYLYYFMPVVLSRRNRRETLEMFIVFQSMCVTSWVAYGIFLICPAHVDLRDQVISGGGLDSWTEGWYHTFWDLDRPYNAWPSLHVAQTFLVVVAVEHWWRVRGKHVMMTVLWIAWAALVVSTMTTKQHFVWDVGTGLLLGLIGWYFLQRPGLQRLSKQLENDDPERTW